MTISQRLQEDELTQATEEELFSTLGENDTPDLFGRPYKFDFDHSIPNGGGVSIDRETVYIDNILYQEIMDGALKATGLEPEQIIGLFADHEHSEVCIMEGNNAIDTYSPAHERALALEHYGLITILGRTNRAEKIKQYEEAIWPALLRCYHRPITNPPKDLWCGPNLDDPTDRDKEIIAELKKFGVLDAEKQSKYDVHYGYGAHRCFQCRSWAPDILSQEDGKLASCNKVSGLVRASRGCDLWKPKTNADNREI